MKSKKAQVSTEFMIIGGIVLFIFLIMVGFSLMRKGEVRETETYLDSNSVCMKFSNAISEAYMSGDGTNMILNSNYMMDFENYTISVKDKYDMKEKASCVFYAKLSPRYNLTGSLKIRNIREEIVISAIL